MSRQELNPDISYPAPFGMGGTGDSPVPVGDSPTGTQSDGLPLWRRARAKSRFRVSAGPVARRDGRVARATQER
jgi:hypothetical protein